MRLAAAFGLVAVALLATGCGERAEPLERELDAFPVAVHGATGEETTLERRPERIAALAPGAARLVAALGAGGRLVGVPFDWSRPSARDAVRVVRPSGILDAEALAAAEPDLIVALPSAEGAGLAAVARATGAAVYVQPADSVQAVARSALALGLLVGEPVRGRLVAARIRSDVESVGTRIGDVPRIRVFVDTGFLVTAPRDSLVADVVRQAGGEPVGHDVDLLGPLAACRLLALEADVVLRVLAADATAPSPARAFRDCPGDRPVPRVARVPEELTAEAGPRIGAAVTAVARVLHPDAFR